MILNLYFLIATKIATFGENVKTLEPNKSFNFSETTTNFDKLIPFIKAQEKNIASITIVSDGIITEGSNSSLEFEKLGIPIFTIPIGDTTKTADISVKSVEYNKLIYLDTKTEISCTILNHNLKTKIFLQLFLIKLVW